MQTPQNKRPQQVPELQKSEVMQQVLKFSMVTSETEI
jgi:hypothetical protein